MAEQAIAFDLNEDSLEWSQVELSRRTAERRVRTLLYLVSTLTVAALSLLVVMMIVAEITRPHLH